MGNLEKEFIKEAFDTNWIAPLGPNVNSFEKEVAQYVGIDNAAALISGTSAIHLAIKLLGIKEQELTASMIDTFREFKETKNIDRTTLVSVLDKKRKKSF